MMTTTITTPTTINDKRTFLDTFSTSIKDVQDKLLQGTFQIISNSNNESLSSSFEISNSQSNSIDNVTAINIVKQTRKADSYTHYLQLQSDKESTTTTTTNSSYSYNLTTTTTTICEGYMTAILCHLVTMYGVVNNSCTADTDTTATATATATVQKEQIQKVINIINSSIVETFSCLFQKNEIMVDENDYVNDTYMIDMILLLLYHDAGSNVLQSYFTSLLVSNKQQTSTTTSNNIFSLCYILQEQYTTSLHNHYYNIHHHEQSRNNKRRRINVDDHINDTTITTTIRTIPSRKEQLWKIPFVYCLSKIIYDLEVQKYQYTSTTDVLLLTVDDFILKVDTVIQLFPLLHNSCYKKSGIAFFLFDCFQSMNEHNNRYSTIDTIDKQEEIILFSDLTLPRVTAELCKNHHIAMTIFGDENVHVPLLNVVYRCIEMYFQFINTNNQMMIARHCNELLKCSSMMRLDVYIESMLSNSGTTSLYNYYDNERREERQQNDNQHTMTYTPNKRSREPPASETKNSKCSLLLHLLQPEYPLLVHLDLLYLENVDQSIRQAVSLSKSIECSQLFTDMVIQNVYERFFNYWLSSNKLFNESLVVQMTLPYIFIPFAGPVAMETFLGCLKEVEYVVQQSNSSNITQPDKDYIVLACHQLILLLLIIKTNEEDGIYIYCNNYSDTNVTASYAKLLLQKPNKLPMTFPTIVARNGCIVPLIATLLNKIQPTIDHTAFRKKNHRNFLMQIQQKQELSPVTVPQNAEVDESNNEIVKLIESSVADNDFHKDKKESIIHDDDDYPLVQPDESSGSLVIEDVVDTKAIIESSHDFSDDEFFDAEQKLSDNEKDRIIKDSASTDDNRLALSSQDAINFSEADVLNYSVSEDNSTNKDENVPLNFSPAEPDSLLENDKLEILLSDHDGADDDSTNSSSEQLDEEKDQDDDEIEKLSLESKNDDVVEIESDDDEDSVESEAGAENIPLYEQLPSAQKIENSSFLNESSSLLETGYDAEESQGNATEEEDERQQDLIPFEHSNPTEQISTSQTIHDDFERESSHLDPGYDAEQSQGYTDQEDIKSHSRNTVCRLETGYDAGDSQGHSDEEEVSEDMMSDDDNNVKANIVTAVDGAQPNEENCDLQLEDLECQQHSLSDMSAADERTGADDLGAESSELEDAPILETASPSELTNSVKQQYDSYSPPSQEYTSPPIPVSTIKTLPRSSLQDFAFAAQRDDDSRLAGLAKSRNKNSPEQRMRKELSPQVIHTTKDVNKSSGVAIVAPQLTAADTVKAAFEILTSSVVVDVSSEVMVPDESAQSNLHASQSAVGSQSNEQEYDKNQLIQTELVEAETVNASTESLEIRVESSEGDVTIPQIEILVDTVTDHIANVDNKNQLIKTVVEEAGTVDPAAEKLAILVDPPDAEMSFPAAEDLEDTTTEHVTEVEDKNQLIQTELVEAEIINKSNENLEIQVDPCETDMTIPHFDNMDDTATDPNPDVEDRHKLTQTALEEADTVIVSTENLEIHDEPCEVDMTLPLVDKLEDTATEHVTDVEGEHHLMQNEMEEAETVNVSTESLEAQVDPSEAEVAIPQVENLVDTDTDYEANAEDKNQLIQSTLEETDTDMVATENVEVQESYETGMALQPVDATNIEDKHQLIQGALEVAEIINKSNEELEIQEDPSKTDVVLPEVDNLSDTATDLKLEVTGKPKMIQTALEETDAVIGSTEDLKIQDEPREEVIALTLVKNLEDTAIEHVIDVEDKYQLKQTEMEEAETANGSTESLEIREEPIEEDVAIPQVEFLVDTVADHEANVESKPLLIQTAVEEVTLVDMSTENSEIGVQLREAEPIGKDESGDELTPTIRRTRKGGLATQVLPIDAKDQNVETPRRYGRSKKVVHDKRGDVIDEVSVTSKGGIRKDESGDELPPTNRRTTRKGGLTAQLVSNDPKAQTVESPRKPGRPRKVLNGTMSNSTERKDKDHISEGLPPKIPRNTRKGGLSQQVLSNDAKVENVETPKRGGRAKKVVNDKGNGVIDEVSVNSKEGSALLSGVSDSIGSSPLSSTRSKTKLVELTGKEGTTTRKGAATTFDEDDQSATSQQNSVDTGKLSEEKSAAPQKKPGRPRKVTKTKDDTVDDEEVVVGLPPNSGSENEQGNQKRSKKRDKAMTDVDAQSVASKEMSSEPRRSGRERKASTRLKY